MPRLGVFISFSGDGGVERMVLNLCEQFVARGVEVDLLALKLAGGHASKIPAGVNLRTLKAQHSATSVREVAHYLQKFAPRALLVAKDRAGRAALRAAQRAGNGVPVWIRLGTNLSAALERKSLFNRALRVMPMKRAYPSAAGVIAVSEGVRLDTLKITGLPPERVHVIRNPVVTPRLEALAGEPAPHPWLAGPLPVILGVGRLTAQKDFVTLIRAFGKISMQRPARLVILGEGGDRALLEQLVRELGLTDRVLLPGFASNPYAWLARAKLFVLSSRWEGSPNALTEALALGIPSVSTDCPSGPVEILDAGRYGPLVPMGDADAMATAMLRVLASPLPAAQLQQAVREYRADVSAGRYLSLMGLQSGGDVSAEP